ncbi:MAG: ABC-2 family transporter protein [Candidatus Methanofastidiosum methylothiophilum]|uniref:ABC-2 family transporter protein n=1 Tax=Candidatus Methanofastidiosum methylothiophilum TaxID=1705564 RepID=A0A150IRB1_9EURY|nr:MAG: ABC-2 family transporter protein [Candidatus Methanofastidiosum methylthiophilus]KYC47408.1 MAG: ABC-2 family transporter protein [Candidatus Methanofastidiosum methylthiophilus]KYC49592.1 MAG: ABC-2 family transporter protein [Candidatus Methanofastidiosum methylthiophilus]
MRKEVIYLAIKEFKDISREKVYILAFLLQLFIVIGIVLIGTSYAYIQTYVDDPNSQGNFLVYSEVEGFPNYLNDESINTVILRDKEYNGALPRNIDGVIWAETENSVRVLLKNPANFGDLSGPIKRAYVKAKTKGEVPDEVLNPMTINLYPKDYTYNLADLFFVEIMQTLLIPLILLLPIFLSMNILSDSIVGEKERKTFEILLASPLKRIEIIIGKILPTFTISIVQIIIWAFVLSIRGISIFNIPILLIFLSIIMLLLFSLSIVFSNISSNITESNLFLTLFMMIVTLIMFVPIPVENPLLKEMLSYSPIIPLIKITSNPSLDLFEIGKYMALYFGLALFSLFIALKGIAKDENIRL